MKGKIIGVLDKGFVELVDYMADDLDVVQAARVSHGEASKGPEADAKLIKFMLTHKHGSPFEHTCFKFHVKVPLFVRAQWHRHRIGVSYNEISARYTEMVEEFYVPEKWRAQDTVNKQGSVAFEDVSRDQQGFTEALRNHCDDSMRLYHGMLDKGIAKEMARMVLPQNLYTEFYFTCNARSLIYFIGLRSDSHAQFEIRQYSHAMAWCLSRIMPMTWDAFAASIEHTGYAEMFRWMAEYDAAQAAV